jgi:hypothetical protein
MLWKSGTTDNPRNCAFCSEPLKQVPLQRDERYFCNELCGDAASEPIPLTANQHTAHRLDQNCLMIGTRGISRLLSQVWRKPSHSG